MPPSVLARARTWLLGNVIFDSLGKPADALGDGNLASAVSFLISRR